jgi:ribosomal protein S18 acetylase RimI-like enzyme
MQIRSLRLTDYIGIIKLKNARAKEGGIAVSKKLTNRKKELDNIKKILKRVRKGEAVFIVAEQDGEIIGFCSIEKSEKKSRPHVATLGILVKKEFRNKGIGKKLINHAIKSAIKNIKGLEIIELMTHSKNIPAIALYKKVGFKEVARIKKYFKWEGKYYDQIIMQKKMKNIQ